MCPVLSNVVFEVLLAKLEEKMNNFLKENSFATMKLRKMDQKMRTIVRSWVGLGHNCSCSMLYRTEYSGHGLLSFSDSYQIASMVHEVRFLNNKDERIRTIAATACRKDLGLAEEEDLLIGIISRCNERTTYSSAISPFQRPAKAVIILNNPWKPIVNQFNFQAD